MQIWKPVSYTHLDVYKRQELHDLLVSKEISATELTQATLYDIKAREEAVNAFVTVAEEVALAQAKAIDEKGIDADVYKRQYLWWWYASWFFHHLA